MFRSVNVFLILIMVWYSDQVCNKANKLRHRKRFAFVEYLYCTLEDHKRYRRRPVIFICKFIYSSQAHDGFLDIFLKINNFALYIHLVTFKKKMRQNNKNKQLFLASSSVVIHQRITDRSNSKSWLTFETLCDALGDILSSRELQCSFFQAYPSTVF